MQQDQARNYALEHVIAIDRHYTDEAVSARKNSVLNRPDMNQIIQEVRKGNIGTILVYKRDRLARNAVEYMEFYRLCRKHNVQILFTAKNEFPVYYTPLGEFIELIMSGMVQHEAEQIAERIRATHIANFKNEFSVGVLPYGLKAVQSGKKMSIEFEPNRKEDISRIFHAFLNDRFSSLKEFVKYINDDLGILRMPSNRKKRKKDIDEETFDGPSEEERKKPGPWQESEVIHLLMNPLFKGLHRRKFGEQTYEVERPQCAVVLPEEWEEIQQRVQPFLPARREYPDFPFLLEGFMVCGICKRPLAGRFHRHHDTLTATYDCRFTKKQKGRTSPIQDKSSNHDNYSLDAEKCQEEVFEVIRAHIEELLEKHLDDLFNRDKNRKKLDLQKEIRLIELDIQKSEDEFRKCVSTELVKRDGQLGLAIELKSKLDAKRKALREKIRERDDYSLLPHLYSRRQKVLLELNKKLEDWSKKEPRQLRTIYAELIHEIIASPEELTIRLKHPFLMPDEEVKPIGFKKAHSREG